jgi:hypothetical protein
MNKRGKTISISGIIMFVLTIFIFFMMTNDKVASTWISLFFLLFAEIILFGGFLMIEYLADKASQIVIRSGCGFVLIVYSIISIIVSMYYIISAKESVKILITIQIAALAIAGVLFAAFYTISVSIKERSDKVINATVRVNSVVDKLKILSQDVNNAKYKKQLSKIAEDLRFTDTSTLVSCDDEINRKLVSLELVLLKEAGSKDSEVYELLEDMLMLINKREIEVKNSKIGGV